MTAQQQNTETERQKIDTVLGLDAAGRAGLFRRWRGRLILAFIVLALIGIVAYWRLGSSDAGLRYVTEAASRSDITVIVTATGTVEPTNQVDVSSELSGTIRTVLVDFNSPVAAGQILAELDTDKLKASVESSKAKLASAKAKVRDAEATAVEKRLEYERKTTLAERRVSSTQDLDAAKAAHERALAAIESAKADVAAAMADLHLNETNLAKSCICSPIDGIVLNRTVEPGQTVAASLQAPVLFTIAEDLKKMEVQVDVDEADVGKVRVGQKAVFTVDAYSGEEFPATIRELYFGSEVVQGVVTYKAVLSADNSELLLRPGMTATAEIIVEELKDVITVPNAALRFTPADTETETDNRSFLEKLLPGRPSFRAPSSHETSGPERKIWVLADGAPKEVAVTVGSTDGRRTQIVSGIIAPGDPVIVDTAANGQ